MSSNNIKLKKLAEETLNQVIKKTVCEFMLFLDYSQCENNLHLLLNENINLLESLESDLRHMNSFRKFLKTPQINDILIDYLSLVFKLKLTNTTPKKKIYKDDIENYFIKIIEKEFKELAEENTLIAIKKYITILKNLCSSDLMMNVYSDFYKLKYSGKNIWNTFSDKKFLIKDIERLDIEMHEEFFPRIVKYEEIKSKYARALKQYYQNGFIYLLGEYEFNKFYIPPILMSGPGSQYMYFRRTINIEKNKINLIREKWKNIFRAYDIIYVVGGAGYGKSLFLRNIINNYSKLDIENIQDYLLIYCDLKTYYNGNVSKKTMIDFFQESMISIAGIEGITKEFVNYYLKIGRCIVLLDALDEVPKSVRSDLHSSIIAFFAACNPNNKVCITSRDRGFLPQQDIEMFEIIPLTETDINDYIEKMIELKKFKKEDKATFMKQAQVLIEKEFLNNFLILSLLVNIYKSERELPENKIDLYKKCFEYIAKKREEEKSKTGYNWNNIYPLMKDSTFIKLSILAAPNNTDISREKVEELLLNLYKTKYSDEAKAECAIKEFLDFCSNRTELFVPASSDDKFKFFHRSFFEYFYSRYIHQQSEINKMYDLMAKFDVDSEVFELTIALVKEDNEEKYQKLINYILKKVDEEFNQPDPIGTAFGILTLAMQVIDDAYYIQKYYEIIINNNIIVSGDKLGNMNQKLISMWIDKAISENNLKIDEFLKTFSDHCACYILKIMSTIRTNTFRELHSDKWKHLHDGYYLYKENIDIQGSIMNIPFYLLIFNKYGDLYGLMEKCINNGFASTSIRNIKKSVMRKGVKNYKNLSLDERKQFLSLLQNIS